MGKQSLIVICCCLGGASCADLNRSDPDSNGTGSSSEPVTYAESAHPVLVDECGDCHESGGEAGNTDYLITGNIEQDYMTALQFIDETDPANSRLLTKARGQGHGGGQSISTTDDDFRTLLDWISQGALP